MKILNTPKHRDVSEQEWHEQKTFVSELPETDTLEPKSLLHIVCPDSVDGGESRYESRRMTAETFQQKIYEAVQNTLKVRYADTHSHAEESSSSPEGTSFKAMLDYLSNSEMGREWVVPPVAPEPDEVDGFVKHVNYDMEILRRYIVKKDVEILGRISTINFTLSKVDYAFSEKMIISTTDQYGGYTSESVNHRKSENDRFCQMQIAPGNKISNKWTVPADGQLVVYGWLDSNAALNNKGIPSAYCVIEANINSTGDGDNWEIVAVQPVIPAKNMTYVGFTFPVHQGLTIRARTGFQCGAKSSQYSNENDGYDSLANDTANGFKCQVFSHRSYKTYES